MTTTVVNNSLFRSLFEKQKLNGNNFMEWYRNLRIVLSTEDKLPFLEQPIPALPVPPQGQANPPDVITTHQAWVKADQELLQTVREFHACKQKEGQTVSFYVLKMKSYIDNLKRLGHAMTRNLSVSLILVLQNSAYNFRKWKMGLLDSNHFDPLLTTCLKLRAFNRAAHGRTLASTKGTTIGTTPGPQKSIKKGHGTNVQSICWGASGEHLVSVLSYHKTDIKSISGFREGSDTNKIESRKDCILGIARGNLAYSRFMFTVYPQYGLSLDTKDLDQTLAFVHEFERSDLMKPGNKVFSITYLVAYALTSSHHSIDYKEKEYIEIDDLFNEIGSVEGSKFATIKPIDETWAIDIAKNKKLIGQKPPTQVKRNKLHIGETPHIGEASSSNIRISKLLSYFGLSKDQSEKSSKSKVSTFNKFWYQLQKDIEIDLSKYIKLLKDLNAKVDRLEASINNLENFNIEPQVTKSEIHNFTTALSKIQDQLNRVIGE
ncbi:reverse transcriptase domain-containing protein [Tanacetum coccineum]|uniref:Reverse transcriptase domain-containing protein n=1 Tax=Tanacetum coccineum TaxID=301880 RepID=A0ABQ4WLD4_9ASTR